MYGASVDESLMYLTMYYIRSLLYGITNVTKRIDYNTNCIGVVIRSDQMGTNTHRITFTVTKP